MLNSVLQRIVVDAVAVTIVNTLAPVGCVTVDLLGWRKWRLRCCGRSSIFAVDWYAELPEADSDCGLPFQKWTSGGHAGAVLRGRKRSDVFHTAPGVPRLNLGVDFGPCCARLIGCHVFRVDRQ